MQAFQSNDMQRLKYFSTILRNPTDARPVSLLKINPVRLHLEIDLCSYIFSLKLRTELLAQNNAGEISDIDSDTETSAGGVSASYVSSKNIEGRAQATGRYTAKDPAGRDIDLEEGEVCI